MTRRSGLIALLVLLCLCHFACGDDDTGDGPLPPDADPLGGWRLLDERAMFTTANPQARLLADGRLLFLGGDTTRVWSYSASTGALAELTPLMGASPERHTVSRLPSGRFLSIGNSQTALEEVQPGGALLAVVYDVATGAQSLAETAPSSTAC